LGAATVLRDPPDITATAVTVTTTIATASERLGSFCGPRLAV
jgi:hypothetical protein